MNRFVFELLCKSLSKIRNVLNWFFITFYTKKKITRKQSCWVLENKEGSSISWFSPSSSPHPAKVFCLCLKQGFMTPVLILNFIWNQCWPWVPGPPAFIPIVLGKWRAVCILFNHFCEVLWAYLCCGMGEMVLGQLWTTLWCFQQWKSTWQQVFLFS